MTSILTEIVKRPTTRRTSRSDKVDLFYISNGHEYTLAAYVDEAHADEIIARAGLRSRKEIERYKKSLIRDIRDDSLSSIRSSLEGQLQALFWVTGLGYSESFDKMNLAVNQTDVRRYVNCSGCPFEPLTRAGAAMAGIPVCEACSSFQNPQGDVIAEEVG